MCLFKNIRFVLLADITKVKLSTNFPEISRNHGLGLFASILSIIETTRRTASRTKHVSMYTVRRFQRLSTASSGSTADYVLASVCLSVCNQFL